MTYASVVSRESVRIALTLAALNYLDFMMGDIEIDYLTAPIKEKVWTVLGPYVGDNAGKRALIVRVLYGLKSARAAFRNHLASVKLPPLPQPQLRAHIRTDKSKLPESHSTKECARACVLCLKTEPKYYYCPITLVMP
jgi:hypothetical protein